MALSNTGKDPIFRNWAREELNFIGPNEEEGITVYHNGMYVARSTGRGMNNLQDPEDRRIILGRGLPSTNILDGSVHVDELLIYNQYLSGTEIEILSQ